MSGVAKESEAAVSLHPRPFRAEGGASHSKAIPSAAITCKLVMHNVTKSLMGKPGPIVVSIEYLKRRPSTKAQHIFQ